VLKQQVLDALMVDTRRGGAPERVFVDATVGAGGHAEALLEADERIRLVAVDRDVLALSIAGERLERHSNRIHFAHAPFGSLGDVLDGLGIHQIDGLLADLGVSSMQLDHADRGMSFRAAGPIDMRMNPEAGRTARELIEDCDVDQLSELIAKLGEERRARRIARCIKQAADAGELGTTLDLRRAVVRAVGPARAGGIDPATRTFQALRIAVNDELGQLQCLMNECATRLRPGARAAIISFHSLEDRIVKRMIKRSDELSAVGRKPVTAGDDEVDDNPRARSAKLRVAVRVHDDASLEAPERRR